MIHPYLTKLGVPEEVQEFFREGIKANNNGDLQFSYGGSVETYGQSFHCIPVTDKIWTAGNEHYSLIRQVFICHSAMDAIAFLSLTRKGFAHSDYLFFVAMGLRPCRAQLDWVAANFPHRNVGLLFGNDLSDKITDLKVAAGLQHLSTAVTVAGGSVKIRCIYRDYHFTADKFSLNQFEKQSGQRLRCRTFKPRQANSWANQLFQKLAKK